MLKNTIAFASILCSLAFSAVIAPSMALAEVTMGQNGGPVVQVPNTYVPLAPLPCIPGNGITCPATAATGVSFQTYVQYTFNFLIAASAVAAVFMIVWGGFDYMTSDAINNKKEGLAKIQHAVEGLLLVLCSYLILRTINPALVNLPSSLVAPLNLTATRSNLTDFLNVLNQVMSVDTLNANNAATRQQIADAQASSTSLQQQLSDAQDAEDLACTPGDGYNAQACTTATNNTDLIQSQLDTLRSNTTFSVAKQTMDNLAAGYGCSPIGDPQACTTQSQKIWNTYLAASGQLQPDQVQALASYALYDRAIVNMEQQSALFYQKGAVGSFTFLAGGATANTRIALDYPAEHDTTVTAINNAANAYINSPHADPTLVSQLRTQQQSIVATVNTMTYHLAQ